MISSSNCVATTIRFQPIRHPGIPSMKATKGSFATGLHARRLAAGPVTLDR
jgi:hypothetical protein